MMRWTPLLFALACSPGDKAESADDTVPTSSDTDTDTDADADTDADTDTDVDTDTDTDTDTGPCEPSGAPDAPLRMLTTDQIDRSVFDLLAVLGGTAGRLPADPTVHGFEGSASTVSVSQLMADGLMRASEDSTAAIDWAALLPCDPASGDSVCAESFIDDLGRRAFRRPMEADERQIFVDLFTAMEPIEGFEGSLALVVQAMLQSPQFLYRIELGDPSQAQGDHVPLTAHELATRLSLLLWGRTPDEELLALADDGTLTDPAVLAAQVDRLLDDPRAREVVGDFVEQWMGLTDLDTTAKDPTAFPTWSPELAADLREETRRFATDVIFDGDGSLHALLTADHTFVNGALADHYGVTPPTDPDAWERVTLPAAERSGLLTQGSFLADAAHSNQTSIVHRGLFVFEQLYCGEQQDPPGDLDITLPPLDDDLSTRERYARHTQDPLCSGCHSSMDPIGLGFEHYDPIGRWRDTEGNAIPVDASGVLTYSSQAGAFYGAVELAGLLTAVPEVQECFVLQWFRMGWGREPGESDTCSTDELQAAFAAGDVPTLLRTLPLTDSFRFRGEVVP